MLVIAYGYAKFVVMLARDDSIHLSFMDKNSLQEGFINLSEQGFHYGAFRIPFLPSYVNETTNETVTHNFNDVFTIEANVQL